jgi:DNA-binding SARP family transcriptional activator
LRSQAGAPLHRVRCEPVPESAAATEPPLLICLMGGFRLLNRGEPLLLRDGGKMELLLTILALRHPNGIRRDDLVCTLWPNAAPELANQSLRTLLYSLHRRLGPALAGAPPVLHRGGACQLNTSVGVEVDVGWFDALVGAGEAALRAGDRRLTVLLYCRAAELYRGDLCAGPDVSTLIERERCRARYLNVLGWLADQHFAVGAYAEALQHALALLAGEPCREDAHRLVMRCHARQGRRAEALRQYQLCLLILRREFDVEPERRTIELFDRIRLAPESV